MTSNISTELISTNDNRNPGDAETPNDDVTIGTGGGKLAESGGKLYEEAGDAAIHLQSSLPGNEHDRDASEVHATAAEKLKVAAEPEHQLNVAGEDSEGSTEDETQRPLADDTETDNVIVKFTNNKTDPDALLHCPSQDEPAATTSVSNDTPLQLSEIACDLPDETNSSHVNDANMFVQGNGKDRYDNSEAGTHRPDSIDVKDESLQHSAGDELNKTNILNNNVVTEQSAEVRHGHIDDGTDQASTLDLIVDEIFKSLDDDDSVEHPDNVSKVSCHQAESVDVLLRRHTNAGNVDRFRENDDEDDEDHVGKLHDNEIKDVELQVEVNRRSFDVAETSVVVELQLGPDRDHEDGNQIDEELLADNSDEHSSALESVDHDQEHGNHLEAEQPADHGKNENSSVLEAEAAVHHEHEHSNHFEVELLVDHGDEHRSDSEAEAPVDHEHGTPFEVELSADRGDELTRELLTALPPKVDDKSFDDFIRQQEKKRPVIPVESSVAAKYDQLTDSQLVVSVESGNNGNNNGFVTGLALKPVNQLVSGEFEHKLEKSAAGLEVCETVSDLTITETEIQPEIMDIEQKVEDEAESSDKKPEHSKISVDVVGQSLVSGSDLEELDVTPAEVSAQTDFENAGVSNEVREQSTAVITTEFTVESEVTHVHVGVEFKAIQHKLTEFVVQDAFGTESRDSFVTELETETEPTFRQETAKEMHEFRKDKRTDSEQSTDVDKQPDDVLVAPESTESMKHSLKDSESPVDVKTAHDTFVVGPEQGPPEVLSTDETETRDSGSEEDYLIRSEIDMSLSNIDDQRRGSASRGDELSSDVVRKASASPDRGDDDIVVIPRPDPVIRHTEEAAEAAYERTEDNVMRCEIHTTLSKLGEQDNKNLSDDDVRETSWLAAEAEKRSSEMLVTERDTVLESKVLTEHTVLYESDHEDEHITETLTWPMTDGDHDISSSRDDAFALTKTSEILDHRLRNSDNAFATEVEIKPEVKLTDSDDGNSASVVFPRTVLENVDRQNVDIDGNDYTTSLTEHMHPEGDYNEDLLVEDGREYDKPVESNLTDSEVTLSVKVDEKSRVQDEIELSTPKHSVETESDYMRSKLADSGILKDADKVSYDKNAPGIFVAVTEDKAASITSTEEDGYKREAHLHVQPVDPEMPVTVDSESRDDFIGRRKLEPEVQTLIERAKDKYDELTDSEVDVVTGVTETKDLLRETTAVFWSEQKEDQLTEYVVHKTVIKFDEQYDLLTTEDSFLEADTRKASEILNLESQTSDDDFNIGCATIPEDIPTKQAEQDESEPTELMTYSLEESEQSGELDKTSPDAALAGFSRGSEVLCTDDMEEDDNANEEGHLTGSEAVTSSGDELSSDDERESSESSYHGDDDNSSVNLSQLLPENDERLSADFASDHANIKYVRLEEEHDLGPETGVHQDLCDTKESLSEAELESMTENISENNKPELEKPVRVNTESLDVSDAGLDEKPQTVPEEHASEISDHLDHKLADSQPPSQNDRENIDGFLSESDTTPEVMPSESTVEVEPENAKYRTVDLGVLVGVDEKSPDILATKNIENQTSDITVNELKIEPEVALTRQTMKDELAYFMQEEMAEFRVHTTSTEVDDEWRDISDNQPNYLVDDDAEAVEYQDRQYTSSDSDDGSSDDHQLLLLPETNGKLVPDSNAAGVTNIASEIVDVSPYSTDESFEPSSPNSFPTENAEQLQESTLKYTKLIAITEDQEEHYDDEKYNVDLEDTANRPARKLIRKQYSSDDDDLDSLEKIDEEEEPSDEGCSVSDDESSDEVSVDDKSADEDHNAGPETIRKYRGILDSDHDSCSMVDRAEHSAEMDKVCDAKQADKYANNVVRNELELAPLETETDREILIELDVDSASAQVNERIQLQNRQKDREWASNDYRDDFCQLDEIGHFIVVADKDKNGADWKHCLSPIFGNNYAPDKEENQQESTDFSVKSDSFLTPTLTDSSDEFRELSKSSDMIEYPATDVDVVDHSLESKTKVRKPSDHEYNTAEKAETDACGEVVSVLEGKSLITVETNESDDVGKTSISQTRPLEICELQRNTFTTSARWKSDSCLPGVCRPRNVDPVIHQRFEELKEKILSARPTAPTSSIDELWNAIETKLELPKLWRSAPSTRWKSCFQLSIPSEAETHPDDIFMFPDTESCGIAVSTRDQIRYDEGITGERKIRESIPAQTVDTVKLPQWFEGTARTVKSYHALSEAGHTQSASEPPIDPEIKPESDGVAAIAGWSSFVEVAKHFARGPLMSKDYEPEEKPAAVVSGHSDEPSKIAGPETPERDREQLRLQEIDDAKPRQQRRRSRRRRRENTADQDDANQRDDEQPEIHKVSKNADAATTTLVTNRDVKDATVPTNTEDLEHEVNGGSIRQIIDAGKRRINRSRSTEKTPGQATDERSVEATRTMEEVNSEVKDDTAPDITQELEHQVSSGPIRRLLDAGQQRIKISRSTEKTPRQTTDWRKDDATEEAHHDAKDDTVPDKTPEHEVSGGPIRRLLDAGQQRIKISRSTEKTPRQTTDWRNVDATEEAHHDAKDDTVPDKTPEHEVSGGPIRRLIDAGQRRIKSRSRSADKATRQATDEKNLDAAKTVQKTSRDVKDATVPDGIEGLEHEVSGGPIRRLFDAAGQRRIKRSRSAEKTPGQGTDERSADAVTVLHEIDNNAKDDRVPDKTPEHEATGGYIRRLIDAGQRRITSRSRSHQSATRLSADDGSKNDGLKHAPAVNIDDYMLNAKTDGTKSDAVDDRPRSGSRRSHGPVDRLRDWANTDRETEQQENNASSEAVISAPGSEAGADERPIRRRLARRRRPPLTEQPADHDENNNRDVVVEKPTTGESPNGATTITAIASSSTRRSVRNQPPRSVVSPASVQRSQSEAPEVRQRANEVIRDGQLTLSKASRSPNGDRSCRNASVASSVRSRVPSNTEAELGSRRIPSAASLNHVDAVHAAYSGGHRHRSSVARNADRVTASESLQDRPTGTSAGEDRHRPRTSSVTSKTPSMQSTDAKEAPKRRPRAAVRQTVGRVVRTLSGDRRSSDRSHSVPPSTDTDGKASELLQARPPVDHPSSQSTTNVTGKSSGDRMKPSLALGHLKIRFPRRKRPTSATGDKDDLGECSAV